MEAKSNTASGMPICLWREGTGSRSSGKERDAETGLDYLGARYYSGAEGRFISPDPLLSSAQLANPKTWNRYSYVNNNPLRFTDPFGLFLWDESAGGNWSDAALTEEINKKELPKARRKWAKDALGFRKRIRSILQADPHLVGVVGREGEINGVTIGFGTVLDGIANTDPGRQYITSQDKYWMDVMITFATGLSDKELRLAVNHEVDHTALVRKLVTLLNSSDPLALEMLSSLTVEDAEVSAYDSSARTAARMRTMSDLTYKAEGRDFTIWRKGMEAADREVLLQFLRASPIYNKKLKDPFFK